VLGGVGFIGRNFVKYLVENKLASFIKVADKSLPATAYFFPEHKEAFANKDLVKAVQADLSKDAHVQKAFDEKEPFDYVINLCGETRFGMVEAEYKAKCLDTAAKTAAAAKKNEVSRWVEVSTAQVYEPGKKPATEEAKLKPWTSIAKFRLQAEEAVKATGVPTVVLRPAVVYGPSDLTGICPRIACAAVYKQLNEQMKFLWDKDLKLNVVHVRDVVQAIWLACTDLKPGTCYNLADEADLDQGKLNEYLGNLFSIKTGFSGSIVSNLAKLNMDAAASYSNDKHVPTFTKLCQDNKVLNTPISPYIDKELLYNNSLFIDGSAITKASSFKYKEKCSQELVKEQVQAAIKQGIFPGVLA